MGLKETSKFISLILRYKPETIGFLLDEHGWTAQIIQHEVDNLNGIII